MAVLAELRCREYVKVGHLIRIGKVEKIEYIFLEFKGFFFIDRKNNFSSFAHPPFYLQRDA